MRKRKIIALFASVLMCINYTMPAFAAETKQVYSEFTKASTLNATIPQSFDLVLSEDETKYYREGHVAMRGIIDSTSVAQMGTSVTATYVNVDDSSDTVKATVELGDSGMLSLDANEAYNNLSSDNQYPLSVHADANMVGVGQYKTYLAFTVATGREASPDNYFMFDDYPSKGYSHITGLTAEGKAQTSLVTPSVHNGLPVVLIKGLGYCNTLKSIYMNNSIKTIDTACFQYCKALSDVRLSAELKKIDSSAFSNCTALTELTLSDSIEEISNKAFYNSGLTTIELPLNLKTLAYSAYEGTPATHCIYRAKDITYPSYFMGGSPSSMSALKTIEICDTVEKIPANIFSGMGVTELLIPDNVKTLANNCFSGCDSLTSLTIGNGISSLSYGAFGNCKNLSIVDMSKSNITEICSSAFHGDSKITNIKFSPNLSIIRTGAFGLDSSVGAGTFTDLILDFSNTSLTTIEGSAFGNTNTSSTIKALYLPTTLQSTGFGAFSGTPIADIYYAGSELQFGNVTIKGKGDTTPANKDFTIGATMHYDYN